MQGSHFTHLYCTLNPFLTPSHTLCRYCKWNRVTLPRFYSTIAKRPGFDVAEGEPQGETERMLMRHKSEHTASNLGHC